MFKSPTELAYMLRRIELLRQLADDLDGIVKGITPAPAELASAPVLRRYRLATRPSEIMIGHCTGHPTLLDGPITTSQIFLLDPEKRWARTLSRFYRLEDPAPNNSHNHYESQS
jgi:hypothetical protein